MLFQSNDIKQSVYRDRTQLTRKGKPTEEEAEAEAEIN